MKNNKAFILDPSKAKQFLNQKNSSATKALERFWAHKPKKGVITPLKKG